MYVIFPADELILMTYGAVIPRINPRPTLDSLRDPQVPILLRSNTTTQPIATATATPISLEANTNIADYSALPLVEQEHVAQSAFTTAFTYDDSNKLPTVVQPIQTRRTSRSSFTRAEPHPSLKRVSAQLPSARQVTPPLYQQQQQTQLPQTRFPANTAFPPTPSMYNDANMRTNQKQQPQSERQRPTLERSSAIRSATPQRSYDPAYTENVSGSSSLQGRYTGTSEYPSGALANARDRSPSIFLEPPTPTQLSFGPGWGRPMSPMDLPPEPPSKSPTSKSRLRPKLHIPLGRLGRASSADQRESNRLKEDLQLHVENPIFNRENLRLRNFDAFFESGESVYKLQPKTPASAPTDGSAGHAGIYSPPLDQYDSTSRMRASTSGSSGLLSSYAQRGEKGPIARARSADVDETAREARASGAGGGVPQKDFSGKSSSGPKSRSFFGWRGPRGGSLSPQASMASYNGVLKDYGCSSLNEAFKSQNNVNFKLIKTVSDFTDTLSKLYEEHATALQTLVSNYRKKNAELRKERPACQLTIFQAWETFLQEVETDSQASNDVAAALSRQVSRPMLDKSFHRKVQSRKIFTHRESFETIITKTEEKLSKCRLDYKQCYMSHRQNPTPLSLTEYIDAHNAYVQQLHATNAMLEIYHCDTVPQLMQELEEIHNDLYSIIADSILQGADAIANKAVDQAKRYSSLTSQCSTVSPAQDLTNFVRILPLPTQSQKVPRRLFAPPQLPGETDDGGDYNEMLPLLRNELVFDRHSTLALRPALESLKREAIDLEMQIRQLQDAIDALNRTQTRGIEGQLYNKVNEMQEDLSMKKFDLRAKQIHLAAIRAQKELYVSKVDPGSPRVERKLSIAATAPSMKTKWLKAFRSLKPASGSATQPDRRNGAAGTSALPLRANEDGSHHLQEYTYKKITACDVCSQILRGHTRQGLRCRICKLNSHGDCAPQLPRCQPKQKLLRRQKSTSELENRVDAEEEIADMETKTTRAYGEPLMLKKKTLRSSAATPASISSADASNDKEVTPTQTLASKDSKPTRKVRLK